MSDTILTISDLSKYLKTHRTTLYRMLREGRLPGFRIGSDWRFSLEAIEKWLRDQVKTDIEGSGVDSPIASPGAIDHASRAGDSPLGSVQSGPASLHRSISPGRARRPTRFADHASPGPSHQTDKFEDEFTKVSPSSHKRRSR